MNHYTKEDLRQIYRHHRQVHHTSVNPKLITQRLREHFHQLQIPLHKIIAGFMPTGTEMNILPFLEELVVEGYHLCLPVVERDNPLLTFRSWMPGMVMEKDALGMTIPLKKEGEVALQPDVLFVPLLVFDELGHRLGQGKGYYDRTLKSLSHDKSILAIGVAYDIQKVSLLSPDPHDYKMDIVMTEEKIYDCS